MLKFSTFTPSIWDSADEDEKTISDGLLESLKDVIPLKPRLQSVKVFVPAIPVYVIISFPIFNNPYSLGNESLIEFEEVTVIVLDVVPIPTARVVSPLTTSVVKLSNFKYWSKLSTRSIGPPVYSWEM